MSVVPRAGAAAKNAEDRSHAALLAPMQPITQTSFAMLYYVVTRNLILAIVTPSLTRGYAINFW